MTAGPGAQSPAPDSSATRAGLGHRPIVAWDNLSVRDWAYDGTSHGYVEHTTDPSGLSRACERVYGMWRGNLRPGGRLQSDVPELPLCAECARLAGLRFVP